MNEEKKVETALKGKGASWFILAVFCLGAAVGLTISLAADLGVGLWKHTMPKSAPAPDLGLPGSDAVFDQLTWPGQREFEEWGFTPFSSMLTIESITKYASYSDDAAVVLRYKGDAPKGFVKALLRMRFTPVLVATGKYEWVKVRDYPEVLKLEKPPHMTVMPACEED